MDKKINRKLKGYRNMAGLRQEDLAAMLGISTAMYSYCETGDRTFPLEIERKIYDILKTKIHNLKMEDVFPIP